MAVSLPSPAAVANLVVIDTPDDNGNSLNIAWDLSADDAALVDKYQILRSESASGPFEVIGSVLLIKGDLAFHRKGNV